MVFLVKVKQEKNAETIHFHRKQNIKFCKLYSGTVYILSAILVTYQFVNSKRHLIVLFSILK